MRTELKLYLMFSICTTLCNGHAIWWEPPSRATLGQHNENVCNVPVNYDHMSLWCGGIDVSTLKGVNGSVEIW